MKVSEGAPRPFGIERRPLKSLTVLCGGLAALGAADSAEAMVADGGYTRPTPTSGKSTTSTPAKTTAPKKAPASQPASPPSRTDASDGYAGMEASRAQLPSSGSSGSGSSSGSSGSGSESSASGSSGSSVGKSVAKAARSVSTGAKRAFPTPRRTDASDGYAGMHSDDAGSADAERDASAARAPSPKRKKRSAGPERAASPEPDSGPKRPNRPPPGTKLGPGGELYPAPQPAPEPQPQRSTNPGTGDESAGQPTKAQRRATRRTVRRAARTVESAVERFTDAFTGGHGPPGESTPPRPRAHPAKAADEDPYPGAPNKGPELGDSILGDLFGLAPFGLLGEGESLSVEGGCGAGTGDPANCVGKEIGGKKGKQPPAPRGKRPVKKGPFLGVDVIGTAATSRGEPDTRMGGKSYTTLDVTADVRTEGSAGVSDGVGTGMKLSGGEGHKTTYSATVREDRAERIVDGEADAPDPTRPRTLRRGESITLADSSYEKKGGAISFRFFRFGGGDEEGETESAAVQRVGKDRIRISVGSEDYVKSSLEIGGGVDEANVALGHVDELREGKRSEIDLDLSAPQGRREYQRFLGTGAMPDPDGEGRSNAATVSGWYASEGDEIKGTLGPATTSDSESGHSESESTKDYLDSEREEVTYEHTWGDTKLQRVQKTDSKGEAQASATSILVDDVSEDVVEDALEARGVDDVPELDDETTVRLDFSDAELSRLKDGAIDKYTENYDDDEIDREEISEQARGRIPPIDLRGSTVDRLTDPTSILTAAEKPEDVAEELQLMGELQGDADEWMTVMSDVDEEYGGGVPTGTITVFADGDTSHSFTVERGQILYSDKGS